MKFTLIDLNRDVKPQMGSHWNTSEKDWYTGPCSVCNERVGQHEDMCSECGTLVVWKNSRVWRMKYGLPSRAASRLARMPEDMVGLRLCALAGVVCFPSESDLHRWQALTLEQHELSSTIGYCVGKLKKRPNGMRGLVKMVLNVAERKTQKPPNSAAEEDDGFNIERY